MKRTTIIFLSLAIALMAGTGASARGKKTTSSSAAAPSVSTVMEFLYELSDNCDGSQSVAIPAGIELLICNEDGFFVFGKNVKATKDRNTGWARGVATGPHAFYVDSYACSDAGAAIYFKSKADRDRFWANFKKSRYYLRGLRPGKVNGWYSIGLLYGN